MPIGEPVLGAAMTDTVVRGLHLLAAMVAVGALVFQRFALRPALEEAAAGAGELGDAVRRRWGPWVHGAILVLLATGFYRYFTVGLGKGESEPSYHMVFGLKFLAALGVFFVATVLVGRGRATERFRAKGRRWLGIGVILALVTVALALHLGSIPAGSTDSATTPAPEGAPEGG